MENVILNEKQLENAVGGGFLKRAFGDFGGAMEDAWDTVVDKVKPYIMPEPPKPNPNPMLDPDAFRIWEPDEIRNHL